MRRFGGVSEGVVPSAVSIAAGEGQGSAGEFDDGPVKR
jgi:hypothetical protein